LATSKASKDKEPITNAEAHKIAAEEVKDRREPPKWIASEHVLQAQLWYEQPAWLVEFVISQQDKTMLTKGQVEALLKKHLTAKVKG